MTRYSTWTDLQLDQEHRRLNRRVNLPGAELWLDQLKDDLAQMEAIWSEMKQRKAAKSQPIEQRSEAA